MGWPEGAKVPIGFRFERLGTVCEKAPQEFAVPPRGGTETTDRCAEHTHHDGTSRRTGEGKVSVGVTRSWRVVDDYLNDAHGSPPPAPCFASQSAFISSKSLTYTQSRSPGIRVESS